MLTTHFMLCYSLQMFSVTAWCWKAATPLFQISSRKPSVIDLHSSGGSGMMAPATRHQGAWAGGDLTFSLPTSLFLYPSLCSLHRWHHILLAEAQWSWERAMPSSSRCVPLHSQAFLLMLIRVVEHLQKHKQISGIRGPKQKGSWPFWFKWLISFIWNLAQLFIIAW